MEATGRARINKDRSCRERLISLISGYGRDLIIVRLREPSLLRAIQRDILSLSTGQRQVQPSRGGQMFGYRVDSKTPEFVDERQPAVTDAEAFAIDDDDFAVLRRDEHAPPSREVRRHVGGSRSVIRCCSALTC